MKAINTTMLLAILLTIIVPALAGDLTVDNLTVSNNATVYGKLDFYTSVVSTNTNSAAATGGAITTNGNYRVHTFTNNGVFEVSGGSLTCSVLVVAGGGAGGFNGGGGGGAGGVVTTNLTVSGNNTVTVGAGGPGWTWNNPSYTHGSNGQNSVFGTITAYGGGAGGERAYMDSPDLPYSGGSGGGGGASSYATGANGTNGQGYAGGNGVNNASGGGGGGAGATGANGSGATGGNGGNGITSDISGSNVTYGGGGGGGGNTAGSGGSGGGGAGGTEGYGNDAVPNTGGGGGGANLWGSDPRGGGGGGSGIVIVRYLINQPSSSNTTTLSISSNGVSQTSASGTNVFISKVGIGTNNPAEKLHVAGNLRIDGTNIVSSIALGGETRTNWPSGAQGALMASNNLSDVSNASAARANLGLGSAATYDAGVFITTNGDGSSLTNITAGQVGAVSTNAGALLAANNLSDLANASAARANLGLGSAATNPASAFLTPTGNGSQLTGITASQVGALSTNGGVVNGNLSINGSISVDAPAGDIPMGVYTNQ